jgi:hypothetical protein
LRGPIIPEWAGPSPALRDAVLHRDREQLAIELEKPPPRGRYGFYNHNAISQTFSHPLLSLEQEEYDSLGSRIGVVYAHPYWDPDLISFLCKVPPRLLMAGGREKGIVRGTVARRFPASGFKRQPKVSARDFFYEMLRAEAPKALERLGSLAALAELEVVDKHGAQEFLRVGSRRRNVREKHKIWDLLTLEAWLRPRL